MTRATSGLGNRLPVIQCETAPSVTPKSFAAFWRPISSMYSVSFIGPQSTIRRYLLQAKSTDRPYTLARWSSSLDSMQEDWIDRLGRHIKGKLTQQDLAARLGMTYQAVNHWFNRRRTPDTLEQFERIAEAAECSPAWMLFGVGPEEPVTSEDLQLAKVIRQLPPGDKRAAMELLRSLIKRGPSPDRTGTDG